jgi:glutaredoxin 2
MSSDDHSAPVREFLRSSNPNLESLLPRFCELGIEDFETLRAFKTWTSDEREELLLGGHFNKLQRLAVQRKADQLASR